MDEINVITIALRFFYFFGIKSWPFSVVKCIYSFRNIFKINNVM